METIERVFVDEYNVGKVVEDASNHIGQGEHTWMYEDGLHQEPPHQ